MYRSDTDTFTEVFQINHTNQYLETRNCKGINIHNISNYPEWGSTLLRVAFFTYRVNYG